MWGDVEETLDFNDNDDYIEEPEDEIDDRDFYKYSFEQYQDIVERFFERGHSFESIQTRYRKLNDRKEIYR